MTTASYPIYGGDFEVAGHATRTLKGELARIGVDAAAMRRAMIAAYEAELNVVIHAFKGSMWARVDEARLDLEIVDEGPGIPDIELAMREGWSTASDKARQMGFGAGMGLPNIRKNSDLFEIQSRPGEGTRIRSTIFLRAPAAPDSLLPAVGQPGSSLALAGRGCRSCMDCVKACPTRALRVRAGTPSLLDHLCIGCTTCIATCSSRVFSINDPVLSPAEPLGPVAEGTVLVIPRGFESLTSQADHLAVSGALARLGFSGIRYTEEWEEALRARAIQLALEMPAGGRTPVICPSCPAAVSLVETMFPSLIPYLVPLSTPVQALAEDMPFRPVTLVAACPAQHAAASASCLTSRLKVVSPRRLAEAVRPLLSGGGAAGAGAAPALASPPGEARQGPAAGGGTATERQAPVLRVTGIRHIVAVLEQMEEGSLSDFPVVELFACDQGCIGSPLFAGDPHVSARRLHAEGGALAAHLPGAEATVHAPRNPYAARAGLRLDKDMKVAMSKLARIDSLIHALPGRDCAACGAPSCAAFAEDVVLGRAVISHCPYTERRISHDTRRNRRRPGTRKPHS